MKQVVYVLYMEICAYAVIYDHHHMVLRSIQRIRKRYGLFPADTLSGSPGMVINRESRIFSFWWGKPSIPFQRTAFPERYVQARV